MILNIYGIYDNKVEAFNTPFFARTNGEAIRMFANGVNQEGSDFGRWANDYCLYRIGSFNADTGELIDAEQNENLGLAVEYLEKRLTPASSGPQNS